MEYVKISTKEKIKKRMSECYEGIEDCKNQKSYYDGIQGSYENEIEFLNDLLCGFGGLNG